MNNLINLAAKLYAGCLTVIIIIGLIIGEGRVDAEFIGLSAAIGMMIGFGFIMIGELIFELKIYIRKCKFMKNAKEVKNLKMDKQEEAAQ